MANYRGHSISANPDIDLGQLRNAFGNVSKNLSEIIAAAEAKYNDLVAYAASPPPVNAAKPSINLGAAEQAVNTAIDNAISEVTGVISAIEDYSDGNWDNPNNKQFLDDFINKYGSSGGGSPSENGGGGGPNSGVTDPEITNEELTSEESTITENMGPDQDAIFVDEELIASEVGIKDATYMVPGDELSADSELLTEEADSALSSLGTSIGFGSSSFSIPSPTGIIEDVKSSSIIGIAGVAAAAAATIGGKVFYDKTKENNDDDNDEQEIDEDIIEINEETASDVNTGFMSGMSTVEFKNTLLENDEVNE